MPGSVPGKAKLGLAGCQEPCLGEKKTALYQENKDDTPAMSHGTERHE